MFFLFVKIIFIISLMFYVILLHSLTIVLKDVNEYFNFNLLYNDSSSYSYLLNGFKIHESIYCVCDSIFNRFNNKKSSKNNHVIYNADIFLMHFFMHFFK